MRKYAIKEIYYSIQGEGAHTGRPAVFVRFSGCNLWSGREEDRHKAICKFCDTNFWGTDGENGGKYTAEQLADVILSQWPKGETHPFIVCTGGEPMLQLDAPLVNTFKANNIEIATETNGTIVPPDGIDWICMSPKANTDLKINKGNEIKLVFPQSGIDPADFVDWDFDNHFLQPMDGPNIEENTRLTMEYCKANPKWRVSIQTHKLLGIP